MSWDGAMSALRTHLETAGAGLSKPVKAVVEFDPFAITDPVIAYWYTGSRESETGGNTLAQANIEEGVLIRAHWPALEPSETLDRLVREANLAILRELYGDVDLGGNAIGLSVDPSRAEWTTQGSDPTNRVLIRILSIQLWIDLAEVAPITA